MRLKTILAFAAPMALAAVLSAGPGQAQDLKIATSLPFLGFPFFVHMQNQLNAEAETLGGIEVINYESEMNRVIAGLTRELPGRFETAGAVLASLITSARYGRPLDYAASLTERYEALQLADLQAAANEVVQPDGLIWIVVGDLDEIRDQVTALEIGPIETWDDEGRPVD
jgi:hypothetical protein